MKLYLFIGLLYFVVYFYMTFKSKTNRLHLITHINNGVSRYGSTMVVVSVIGMITLSIVAWPIEIVLLVYKLLVYKKLL